MTQHFRAVSIAIALLLLTLAATAEERTVPVPNGDFEEQLESWTIPQGEGMSTLSTEQAASGKYSLKIADDHDKNGSNAHSARVPINGAGAFELRGKVFPVSGSGLGIYPHAYDANGKMIGAGDQWHRGAPADPKGKWVDFRVTVYTSEDARFLDVWLHTYSHAHVVAYVDDLHFVDLGAENLKPPWEGTYKIRADQKERLTEADVVGPDGIVYPDWTYAGVPGGIPEVPVKAKVEDFGGRANDQADDSRALQQAADQVGAQGGGAILLSAGAYYLDLPVTVRHDGVVFRGAGADKTKVLFRYAIPEEGVGFYGLTPGQDVGPNTRVELHATPKDLMALEIWVEDQRVSRWERSAHSGNSFATSTNGAALLAKTGEGKRRLRGVAEYRGEGKKECALEVVLSQQAAPPSPPGSFAVFGFQGRGYAGPKIKLTAEGARGSREVQVETTAGLARGDAIMIEAPKTERWDRLVRNECRWGTYRRYYLRIEGIEGNTLRVNQPLRIEYPLVDGSYVQKVEPIRRCGIEDLYLEQTEDLWINSIQFAYGWECWARGVTVRMTGRFPCHATESKWCEIRDCIFDDAWFKGGGGTAYVGWQHTCDCLMDNVVSHKMRHAPCVQWAASGNVIRKSVFNESDGQWHAGWTNENLFEQCVIDAKTGNGSYGFGFWASPPEDDAHGPNGPRNVVYNCDVRSPKSGLWMGGMNENWLILHNRFVVDRGDGIFAKTASFDHLIHGNVFALKETGKSALFLATPDCLGVELTGNRVHGEEAKLFAGMWKPAVDQDNQLLPPNDDPPRPQPAVPSIFEWQRAKSGKR